MVPKPGACSGLFLSQDRLTGKNAAVKEERAVKKYARPFTREGNYCILSHKFFCSRQ